MEDNSSSAMPLTASPSVCSACLLNVSSHDAFCNNCGYLLHGTAEEQRNFMTNFTVDEINRHDYHQKLRNCGYSLFAVAGIFFLDILWEIAVTPGVQSNAIILLGLLVMVVFVCGIYIGLGFWAKRNPLPPIIIGASLYGLVLLISAVRAPASLFSGLIVKGIVIGCFFYGIRTAKEAKLVKESITQRRLD